MALVNPVVERWIQDGRRDPEQFWAKAASALPWMRPWDRVFELSEQKPISPSTLSIAMSRRVLPGAQHSSISMSAASGGC